MKVRAQILKWGNGLALRVSGAMRDIPHLKEGTKVSVEITEEGFSVKKITSKKQFKLPFNEAQLLESLNSELAHADLLTNLLTSELDHQ